MPIAKVSSLICILLMTGTHACTHTRSPSTAQSVNASENFDYDSNYRVLWLGTLLTDYYVIDIPGASRKIDLSFQALIDSTGQSVTDLAGNNLFILSTKAPSTGAIPKSKPHIILSVPIIGRIIASKSGDQGNATFTTKKLPVFFDSKQVANLVIGASEFESSALKVGDNLPDLAELLRVKSSNSWPSFKVSLTLTDVCANDFDQVCDVNAVQGTDSQTGEPSLEALDLRLK